MNHERKESTAFVRCVTAAGNVLNLSSDDPTQASSRSHHTAHLRSQSKNGIPDRDCEGTDRARISVAEESNGSPVRPRSHVIG